MLSLDTAMVVTVADEAGLGISQELFTLLFLINWCGYIAMVIVVIVFGYKMLQLWGEQKEKKRRGYDEENE